MKLTIRIVSIVFVILAIFFCIYASLNYVSMRNYHQSAIQREINNAIGNIFTRIELSEELTGYVMDRIDEKNLSLARSLAEIIKSNPNINTSELSTLASVLEMLEIDATDGQGVIEISNFSDYLGFDYASAESTKKYLDLLSDPALEIAENPRTDEISGNTTQYYGIARKDKPGFIQIGFDANFVADIHNLLGVQHSIEDMELGDNGFAFVLKDGTIIAHQQGQRIGEDVTSQDWYQEIAPQETGYGWLNMDGDQFYSGYQNTNGYLVVACLPESEFSEAINGFRTQNILMACFIGFMAVFSLWYVVNHLVIRPINRLSGDLAMLAQGDLNIGTQSIGKRDRKTGEIRKRTDEIGALQRCFVDLVKASRQQAELIQCIAEGDLTVDFSPRSPSDIVGYSLIKMLDENNAMLNQVRISSGQLAETTQAIADGSQNLAQASSEQAATVEQLSATVGEVTQMIHDGAKMAGDASHISGVIKDSAEKGSCQMDQMVSAIHDIRDASLGIGKIMKVIDDIAFQTNILALNAAVEAARAGQHGKGFSVVAEEVRTLASKSAEAAKDTSALITDTMEKAELGVRITTETAAGLTEIVQGITDSNRVVSDIAQLHIKQKSAIENINIGIDHVSQVVQKNSAAAEESAASSAQLNEQALTLSKLVARFKLKRA